MPNSNPQAIAFSNGEVRPMADLIYSTYLSAKKLNQTWNAQSLSTVIPNDAVVIADGAATDGRPQITDAQVNNIVTRCQEIVLYMENGLTGSAFLGSSGLGTLNTVVSVQVNGQTKF